MAQIHLTTKNEMNVIGYISFLINGHEAGSFDLKQSLNKYGVKDAKLKISAFLGHGHN